MRDASIWMCSTQKTFAKREGIAKKSSNYYVDNCILSKIHSLSDLRSKHQPLPQARIYVRGTFLVLLIFNMPETKTRSNHANILPIHLPFCHVIENNYSIL